MTEDQQRQYLAEFMAELDEGSRLATAIDEGRAEGREEGASAERQRIAEILRNSGVSEEIISKL